MDGAVIPNDMRGEYHGEFRRGVKGARARTRSLRTSYRGHREVGWAERYPRTDESEEPDTDALGSRAQEDLACTEGAMGKDNADGINTRAHNEPSSTQQDCCGTACS